MSPQLPGSPLAAQAWLWLALGCGAAAVGATVWLVAEFLTARRAEDRTHRDRPPMLWRLSWSVVRPLAERLAPVMSVGARRRLGERLQRAGLDFALDAEQFVAGRLVAAAMAMVAATIAWSPRGAPPSALLACAAALGFALPGAWLKDRVATRARAILKQLPFFLDVITLSVETGMNLSGALDQAVDKGPRGPLRAELERTLRDLRAGRGREEALRGLAERVGMPAVGSLVAALLVAEKQGGALGPVLRAQAEQRRNERFLRAEKLAMEAPVKMLPPLLIFIFPCTFVVLLFPVASRFIQEGWLR